MALVAQESIAVLNFEGTGISVSEAISLTDRFRTDLVRTNMVTVVERGQMENILKEQDFQLSGCTSEECAVEVGQLLGVTSMVAGTIGKLGSTYIIDIRMIDVESGKITLSLKKDYRGEIDGLLPIITELAAELVGGSGRVLTPGIPVMRTTTISISSEPSGAVLMVEGVKIGVTPISDFEAIADHRYNFSFAQAGYARLDTAVSAASGQNFQLNASLIPVSSWLSIAVIPPDVAVTINGRAVLSLPLRDEMLEADTSHTISFSKKGYHSLDTVLYAIRGEHHDLSPHLVENSFLTLSTEPSGAQVLIDRLAIGTSPLQRYELISGKSYAFTIRYPGYRTIDTTVATSVGSTHELSILMNRITNWLSIQGDQGAQVNIDKKNYGYLPINKIELPTGRYQLDFTKPEYFPYSQQVQIEENNESVVGFSMRKKPKLPALAASLIIPGTGQLYQGYWKKGIVMFLGAAGLTYIAAQNEIAFQADVDTFEADREIYRAARKLGEIKAARIKMESSFNTINRNKGPRYTILGVLAGVWTINILDVAF